MKTIKSLLVGLIAITVSVTSFAQKTDHSKMVMTKTEKINVSGNCESCKERIEKAVKIEGVTKADWNIKTKILTLVYDPSKVNADNIQKRIAAVGHDTPKYKAANNVYNALPACCKYRKK